MANFIPDLTVILAFALAGIFLAITPGPDMALFISRTVNYGRAHGFMAVSGAMTGLLVHITLAALGVSVLLAAAPAAFFALKIAGALYLLWLAYGALKQNGNFSLLKKARKQPTLLQSYLTGIGINLTNPKIILFFVTFLPQFVSAADPYATQKLAFLGFEFLAIGFPIVILIVLTAEWVANVLTRSQLAQKLLNYSFAAVFAGFAGALIFADGKR